MQADWFARGACATAPIGLSLEDQLGLEMRSPDLRRCAGGLERTQHTVCMEKHLYHGVINEHIERPSADLIAQFESVDVLDQVNHGMSLTEVQNLDPRLDVWR
jgi:hypothetical protein